MAINFLVTKVDNGGFLLTYRDAEYREHIEHHHSEFGAANSIEAALSREAVLIEQQRELVKKERQSMGAVMAGIGGLNSTPFTAADIRAAQESARAQAYATAEQPPTSTDASEDSQIF